MGRKSKEEGMCEYLWLIHFAVCLKLGQHCKATIIKKKNTQEKNLKNK